MVEHYNPSTTDAKAGGSQFEANLVYTVNVRSMMWSHMPPTPTARTGLPLRDHTVKKIALCADGLHSHRREERQELAAGVCL